MSSTFKFHSQVPDVVPWQAQYQFPSQANKVRKQTVKLPPKNGYTFTQPNQVIRIEFPADNYCNMLNSLLVFNANITIPASNSTGTYLTLQRGGGHNFFTRLRVLYGSLVIEDIQEYKTLVRMINEVAVPRDYGNSSGTILDGMSASRLNEIALDTLTADGGAGAGVNPNGNILSGNTNGTTGATVTSIQKIVETSDQIGQIGGPLTSGAGIAATTFTDGASATYTKTFAINLLSGLLTCKKLIPLKWMASQLVIELTLQDVSQIFISDLVQGAGPTPLLPTYSLDTVNFIAEMLEFDSTYDLAFFQGLSQDAGVPIKFTSWHYHQFSLTSSQAIYQVHERSRSVKSAYAIIRQSAPSLVVDSDIFFHNLNDDVATTPGKIAARTTTCPVSLFQWRIGGQYYPAQPVICTYGAPEAYVELMKAIDSLGDYTVSSSINSRNFTINYTSAKNGEGAKFVMGASFETIPIGQLEINGINAEEQSDLALTISCGSNAGGVSSYTNGTNQGKKLEVFVNYDTMLIIRKGNVVDLIL